MSAEATTAPRAEAGRGAAGGRFGAAAVYAAGGVVYYFARELGGLNFLVSPLFYGVIVLAASWFRPKLLASAIILIVWGIAVLVDGHGPLAADRTAPVHTAGFGIAALVLLALRRRIDPAEALQSLALIMVVVGIWYYLAHDYHVLERPWLWLLVFLASALALVGAGFRQRAERPAPTRR